MGRENNLKNRMAAREARIKQKRLKRQLFLFGLFVAFALVVWVIIFANMHHYVKRFPRDKIADNIIIGSLNVSGMTKKEAKALFTASQTRVDQVVITAKVNDQEVQMQAATLGLAYKDVDKVIDEALAYGSRGGTVSRYFRLKKLAKEGKTFKEDLQLDKDLADAVFAEQVAPLCLQPKDAAITHVDGKFAIEEEQTGFTLDLEKTRAALEKKVNDKWDYGDVVVEVVEKKQEPRVKKSDLEGITDLLGSSNTAAGSGARVQNIQVGTEKLNGSIIMPGEELSFLSKVVPFTAENGYAQAGVYEENRVIDDYGGGICQVSTTLYNAAIYAELEIVERYPHSMTVAYVYPSMDAAIADDMLDLVIRNPYDQPVYVEGFLDGNGLINFNIYGKETREAGRVVSFESETLNTEASKAVYEEDPSMSFGAMKSEGHASDGKDAQLWKIVTINGEEVSREVFNTSHYTTSNVKIKVGSSGASGSVLSALHSAIASQSESDIYAVIAGGSGGSSDASE